MTPERIEEQVTAVVIGINYGRSEKLTEDEEDIIRLALRQCAREAADEALERAAEWCASARQEWIDKYGLDLRAYDAGRITALENAAIVIRALKMIPAFIAKDMT